MVKEKVEEGKETAEEIIKSVPAHLQATRIPLKLCCGEPVPFSPQDMWCSTMAISCTSNHDVKNTSTLAVLIPGGQIPIPRDEDLDILEADCAWPMRLWVVCPVPARAAVLRAGAGVGNIIPHRPVC